VLIVYSITTPVIIRLVQQIEKADATAASIAGEVFSSIRTAFSLGAEESLKRKYFESVAISKGKGMKISIHLGLQLAPIFLAMYSSFALAFWFGIKLFREGHIHSVSTVVTWVTLCLPFASRH